MEYLQILTFPLSTNKVLINSKELEEYEQNNIKKQKSPFHTKNLKHAIEQLLYKTQNSKPKCQNT